MQKTRAVENAIKETLERFQVEEPSAEYVLDLVRNQREY
jgi:hypothetical protein